MTARSGRVRIGVLSDTHIPEKAVAIPKPLMKDFEGVELILHAGDLIIPAVLEILRKVAPVEAVAGNNDPSELVQTLGRRKVIEVGGIKIGLVHGDRGRGRNTPDRAARAFDTGEVAVVVFGHSHLPYLGPPPEDEGRDPNAVSRTPLTGGSSESSSPHAPGDPNGISPTCMTSSSDPSEPPPTEPRLLLFNPGSPTDRRHAPRKSYGFIEIEDGKVTARHVLL